MTLIIKAREHKPVVVPAELILQDRRLDLFPDLKGEKLFRIRLRADVLEVQPTGYIGFIPLNNRVAIEVAPRMPVANVEYLMARSKRGPAETLPYLHSFGAGAVNAAPFMQLLATRYATLLDELRYEGVYKTYARRCYVSASPSGRLLPLQTALRSRTAQRATAVYERFDRTIDNPPNRVILTAGRRLLRGALFGGGGEPKLARFIERGLELLDGVPDDPEPEVPSIAGLPEQRPMLRQLVALSAVILREEGIRLRGEGLLRLPSFLIKMEDVFEDYTRIVLQESVEFIGVDVYDGNKQPPAGAAKLLFTDPGVFGNRDTTPDIVISRNGAPIGIVEVKYKPCETAPERDNLNQLLTYAITYGVKIAVLLYPAMDKQQTGVERLGAVQGIDCYRALIDLSNVQIEVEEAALSAALGALFAANAAA
ncbi:McrC family protein [Sphingomonas sp. CROZ-RG-20F-R02-07]|uniref:McrC family protein n=1 Tax=Sphingomonas sp. CROZ-RG-20F-R02-07 TaxID=2914832 RepID=UPI001F598A43|nr:McrC family protein [Sphingomonas sp. CROZ-RG-20F-R02-07]